MVTSYGRLWLTGQTPAHHYTEGGWDPSQHDSAGRDRLSRIASARCWTPHRIAGAPSRCASTVRWRWVCPRMMRWPTAPYRPETAWLRRSRAGSTTPPTCVSSWRRTDERRPARRRPTSSRRRFACGVRAPPPVCAGSSPPPSPTASGSGASETRSDFARCTTARMVWRFTSRAKRNRFWRAQASPASPIWTRSSTSSTGRAAGPTPTVPSRASSGWRPPPCCRTIAAVAGAPTATGNRSSSWRPAASPPPRPSSVSPSCSTRRSGAA